MAAGLSFISGVELLSGFFIYCAITKSTKATKNRQHTENESDKLRAVFTTGLPPVRVVDLEKSGKSSADWEEESSDDDRSTIHEVK